MLKRTLALGSLATVLSATVASAQSAGDAPALNAVAPKGVTVTVGALGVYEPKYQGSKSYEFNVLPIIKFDTGSALMKRFDVRSLDDISFSVVQSDSFQLGILGGYCDERKQSDSPRLNGMGDIDGGLVVGGFARYNLGPGYLRASYHRQVTDDDNGAVLKLIAGGDYQAAPGVMLHVFTGVEVGDRDYMQTYFGVTAAQSARSGLTTFAPGGGIKSFHLGIGTDYEILPTWTLTASAEYVRFLGDASRSPIVEETDQVTARIGLSKSFQFDFGNR
jgi:outer membrane scaffolding protein for murein synthesis (MipA/OmpV family)